MQIHVSTQKIPSRRNFNRHKHVLPAVAAEFTRPIQDVAKDEEWPSITSTGKLHEVCSIVECHPAGHRLAGRSSINRSNVWLWWWWVYEVQTHGSHLLLSLY